MTKKNKGAFVASDDTEILAAMVGLKGVRAVGYVRYGSQVELVIEQVLDKRSCDGCGTRCLVKERPLVRYVDLPVYGTRMVLAWRKHRYRCPNLGCPVGSWVGKDHRIAAARCRLTTRAAKWATQQVGTGRTVKEVAAELGCDWHTVNNAVMLYGTALLEADRKRLNRTTAIGLDETRFIRLSGRTSYVTTVADVQNHQIIDIVPTRNYVEVAKYLDRQPEAWKQRIEFGALDMSNTYAAVYDVVLPQAAQVVDPFHVVALANRALDEVRRRVQRDRKTGRKLGSDPLYRARRALTTGRDRLTADAALRLETLLALGDPDGEVSMAYLVKERIRESYRAKTIDDAKSTLQEVIAQCSKTHMPGELRKLGRTLTKWFHKIINHHKAKISNGPTESLNNLIKRIKRIGFGFRNFNHYRTRALLYAGKPNWRVLGSITVQ